MKITTQEIGDSVVCRLPDGRLVEIEIVSVEGEDVSVCTELPEALQVLRRFLAQSD